MERQKSQENQKNFWNQMLNRLSIKNKLLATLLPVIITAFFVLLLTIYFISFRESQNLVNQQLNVSMDQQIQLVNAYLGQLRDETEVFMFDKDIQGKLAIQKSCLPAEESEKLNEEFIQSMLSMIVSYNMNVESFCIKNLYGDYYVWRMDNRIRYSDLVNRLNLYEKDTTALGGKMLFSYEMLEKGCVTLTRLIKEPITGKKLGLLMIDFNLGALQSYSSSLSGNEAVDPTLVIVNSAGDTIFNSSPLPEEEISRLCPELEMLQLSGNSYRLFHTPSHAADWDLYLVINESKLYKNIHRLFFLQTGIVLLGSLLVVLTIYKISQAISRQFQRFQEKISQTYDTKERALIQVDSEDEFRDLALVYNEMIGRIDNLIDTVYSKELLRKNAELRAFQAQINPHFLYNTLDCINGLAEAGRLEEIKQTVTALAGIMRMSIKGDELLTVQEDLKYTDQYMYIEKLRYGEKILYLKEIPESMMKYYIPKLILQPLLENSIVHGVSGLLKQGMIGLFGKEEETAISFTVKDNGSGIPEGVIEALQQEDLPPSGIEKFSKEQIGLRNIHARIRLMYGPEYGLTIKSPPSGGSCVIIRLPKLTYDDIQKTQRGDRN